ncbi:MAG: CDP-alcohol phosphatidyltransferase family protein [Gemmatimonadota bacterium]|nr:CDP-alcohol phosphatidyltransferase family protein [Gemmatimonadota bacterium]
MPVSSETESPHKLPLQRRYFNISVLWIFYYERVIRTLYRLRIRHEVATVASISAGLAAAWLIVTAHTLSGFLLAALLVHAKDLFDACDGALARLTNTGHRLGRFMDTIGDGVVFTAWIAAGAYRGWEEGVSLPVALALGVAAWLSLFLQCSYFNYHQLHYVRRSGAALASRLDERADTDRGVVGVLAGIYDLWFGWQDRMIARFDGWQRELSGFPADPLDPANNAWFDRRNFMVANSALCFGTHAFVLIVCLLAGSAFWFLPAVIVCMNLYWVTIIITRRLVFRRGMAVLVA